MLAFWLWSCTSFVALNVDWIVTCCWTTAVVDCWYGSLHHCFGWMQRTCIFITFLLLSLGLSDYALSLIACLRGAFLIPELCQKALSCDCRFVFCHWLKPSGTWQRSASGIFNFVLCLFFGEHSLWHLAQGALVVLLPLTDLDTALNVSPARASRMWAWWWWVTLSRVLHRECGDGYPCFYGSRSSFGVSGYICLTILICLSPCIIFHWIHPHHCQVIDLSTAC